MRPIDILKKSTPGVIYQNSKNLIKSYNQDNTKTSSPDLPQRDLNWDPEFENEKEVARMISKGFHGEKEPTSRPRGFYPAISDFIARKTPWLNNETEAQKNNREHLESLPEYEQLKQKQKAQKNNREHLEARAESKKPAEPYSLTRDVNIETRPDARRYRPEPNPTSEPLNLDPQPPSNLGQPRYGIAAGIGAGAITAAIVSILQNKKSSKNQKVQELKNQYKNCSDQDCKAEVLKALESLI